jgi:poly(A) polymerase
MLRRIRALFGRKDQAETPAEDPGEIARTPVHIGPKVVHRPIPVENLDPDAVKIIQRLTRFDHTAYLVGGCVRDLLLERHPKDFDVATSATPRQVKRLFRNCRIIGRRFRLAHIYFQNGKVIEVATFRARDGDEVEPSGRGDDLLIRDDNVFGTPEDDALRRDFTINGLFYDVNDRCVIDHADGLGDLRRRFVRTIGDPEVRFREDPIRILRAIKFAARLGFAIEDRTLRALHGHREEIPRAAAPRILEELNRFCRGAAARRSFELLRETGVFEVILPEYAAAYGGAGEAWATALHLLEHMDRRSADGREVTTGEIFAVLVLPLVAIRMGWNGTPPVESSRGLDARAAVDELLRPAAQRLRVSRKDQEYCRLILQTLFRMVPAGKAGRAARRSIPRRECLAEVLWILPALAERWGGEFSRAAEHWRAAAEQRTTAAPARRPAPVAVPEPQPAAERTRRRRRGRRPRPAATAAAPAARPRGQLPPVWDDRYFFAALPTVPNLEDDAGDRYGAGSLAGPGRAATGATSDAAAAAGDTPRPRRRRRRRRARARGGAGHSEQNGSGSP